MPRWGISYTIGDPFFSIFKRNRWDVQPARVSYATQRTINSMRSNKLLASTLIDYHDPYEAVKQADARLQPIEN
jgi:hypothetical protein